MQTHFIFVVSAVCKPVRNKSDQSVKDVAGVKSGGRRPKCTHFIVFPSFNHMDSLSFKK